MTFEVILVAILMFFVLVGIHEFGHFIVAKRVGILTREFAIGFGPKLFSYKKNETQYTFRLLPMGGYVRMAGEDPELVEIQTGQTIAVRVQNGHITHLFLDKLDERSDVIRGTVEQLDLEKKLQARLNVDGDVMSFPVHDKAMMVTRGKETQIAPWDRQFGSKTAGQRAAVIFAGPLMNLLLAFALFFSFTMSFGIPIENPTYVQIGNVMTDTPAEAAGLQDKDVVHTVNGELIGGQDSEKLISLINGAANEPMSWVVIREETQVELEVTPNSDGLVGITIQSPTRSPGVWEGLTNAGDMMYTSTVQIFDALKMLVTLQLSFDDLGGPVRITEMTGDAYSHGIHTLISWVAILSLYLGIFNLLPFPALDGSRLLFFLIEAVRGKPVDPRSEGMVHFIGFAALMLLMFVVTYNDILRLFKG